MAALAVRNRTSETRAEFYKTLSTSEGNVAEIVGIAAVAGAAAGSASAILARRRKKLAAERIAAEKGGEP